MSLIHWLNQHPVFIEEVTFQVQDDMKGRPIHQTSEAGNLKGEVTDFKLLLPLQLDFAECLGLTCAIPFKATGVATGQGLLPGGKTVNFTREGQVYGVVDVRFPEGGWSPEAYLSMYPHIERIVSVESVEFTEG
ncbi:MAG: hypothetical protein JWL81_3503 [Verrucomicrobiales bacterium]|nr:hypothetical protein [Verrucomicrobiales bacterium]